MNFSIKQKLYGSFGLIILVLFIGGIYIYSSVLNMEEIDHKTIKRYDQLANVQHLRQISTSITLVAMDSIIDKDEGKISNERVDEINRLFDIVWKKEKDFKEMADEPEEKILIEKIMAAFKKIEPIIKNDLKRLINTKATQEAFTKLDDDIDNAAGTMDKDLSQFINLIHEDLKDAEEVQEKYEVSMIYALVTTISIIIILALILATFISKGILNGLKQLNTGILNLITSKNTNSKVVLNSKDELAEIAANFNRYIESIQKEKDKDNELILNAKEVMTNLKEGNYSILIEKNTTNEGIQELKNEVNSMIAIMRDNFSKINTILEKYSKNDYRSKVEISGLKDGEAFHSVILNINKLRDVINTMLLDSKTIGLTLFDNSNVLLENVKKLDESSNKSAASIEETAAAVEEVTSNIRNNTQNIAQVSELSSKVIKSSNEGEKLANETSNAMDEINVEVAAINDAISVIDQIAFQTNILSLNAAVEAATAGEAGKGFAVVAGEVRNLASRSAEAAKEIKDIVEKATNKANIGKDVSQKMINGYKMLNENISQTTSLISDIETSAKEQLQGVEQINDSISQLDSQTQNNAAVATQTSDVAMVSDKIAKEIVKNADEKEFLGKDNVKAKTIEKDKTKTMEQKIIKEEKPPVLETPKTVVNKPIIEEEVDGEWESF